jgi:hypothetical protein
VLSRSKRLFRDRPVIVVVKTHVYGLDVVPGQELLDPLLVQPVEDTAGRAGRLALQVDDDGIVLLVEAILDEPGVHAAGSRAMTNCASCSRNSTVP